MYVGAAWQGLPAAWTLFQTLLSAKRGRDSTSLAAAPLPFCHQAAHE